MIYYQDIFKSKLDTKYINFWSNVASELQKNIKGDVHVLYESMFLSIKIIIYIEKFNYKINFSFPITLEDKEIVQKILQSIKFKIYKEVFEMEGE